LYVLFELKLKEFHGYAAEELGLLGSLAIAANYRYNGIPVHAMMQLDMTGYNPNQKNKIGLVTNGVDAELTEFSRKLVDEYCKIGYENTVLRGGTSDHAAWLGAGYRACFPFEAVINPHIHTENDLMDKLDLNNAIEWIKLGISFLIETSSQ
jgi:bacterial leucyl aminopeptidase